MQTTTTVAAAILLCLTYALQRFWNFNKAVKSIDDHPGARTLLWRGSVIANIFPTVRGLWINSTSVYELEHQEFANVGWDIISEVSAFPVTKTLFVADPSVVKEVTAARSRFPKPVDQYQILSFFGKNIVASEGEEWKNYRKISAPAFSERNNKLTWNEAVRTVSDLLNLAWKDQEVITVDHAADLTMPIALSVISMAGFGQRISWQGDSEDVPNGHRMTFKDTIHTISSDIFWKLVFPDSLLFLTTRLRRLRVACEELQVYMREMIAAKRASKIKSEQCDLFSNLLEANEEPDWREIKLNDTELIGNIFVFLVAGHETSANTICFALALLALHQEEQQLLYQHIVSLFPDGRIPTYEEMPLLTRVLAVFYETLRMRPSVTYIPKYSAEDTVIWTSNIEGERKGVPVPQGTNIVISTPALHHNPRYWEDPKTFRPSRFLEENWPRDAFLPFSGGARACIGRKFFETSAVAILTILVSRYKIEVKEEPQFTAETFEQRKERILKAKDGLTLTPVRVPLVFKRRQV